MLGPAAYQNYHPSRPIVVVGPVMPEMPSQPPAYSAVTTVPYEQPPSYEDTIREEPGRINAVRLISFCIGLLTS